MGTTWKECDGKPDRVVFEMIRRTITADGERLLVPDIRVITWRTSLKLSANEVTAFYYDYHSSERYHSENISNLDLERLLSGKLAASATVLSLRWWPITCCGCATSRRREDHCSYSSRSTPTNQRIFRRRLRSLMQDFLDISGSKAGATGRRCAE